MADERGPMVHRISVVIPVYRGQSTLAAVVGEVLGTPDDWTTPAGHRLAVDEVLLVWDHGPDRSDEVIRELSRRDPRVRPVWLSRNFGQHAATLAGMASSGGDWVVTMDEDGQHDVRDVAVMLDSALERRAGLVYGAPSNEPPHGWVRNLASRTAKRSVSLLAGNDGAMRYQSFRLMLGEVARSVAAYAGSGVYLDVALGWVTGDVVSCPVEVRAELDRPSGYTLRSLLSHYWRMVISSGTRALRMVSMTGVVLAVLGIVGAVILVVEAVAGHGATVQGWSSTIVVLLVTSGVVMFSLGVIAEYLGAVVGMAMGRPLYVIGTDPADGPLGRAGR